MRQLLRIVLHYTATPPEMDIGVEEIRRWHLERGWADVGYHFVVRLDGEIERGRPVDVQGAHAYGHNAATIGVVYVGGGTGQDTRTGEQDMALEYLIGALQDVFGPMDVIGHRDLKGAATLCPGFNASEEYGS